MIVRFSTHNVQKSVTLYARRIDTVMEHNGLGRCCLHFGLKPRVEPVLLANVNSRSRSLYAIARPSVCLSSVTLVRPTQAVEIFGNISTAFGTLANR